MRRYVAVVLGVLLLAGASPTFLAADATVPVGSWSLSNWSLAKGVSLSLSYRKGSSRWEWTNRQPLEELQGLSSGQLHALNTPVSFTLRRDAGTFAFDGNVALGIGKGSFRFTPDPGYVSQLRAMGYESVDDDAVSVMMMAIRDISLDYARDVQKAGLHVVEVSDLVGLLDHAVSREFICAVGSYGNTDVTAADAIELHDHGVDVPYLQGLRALGDRRPLVEEIVSLHDHGVTPEYVKGIHAAGYEELTPDQIIRLHDHGVDTRYVSGLRAAGYGDLRTDDIVRLHDHGVGTGYVERVRAAGYGDLSVDQIIRLHEHGVD